MAKLIGWALIALATAAAGSGFGPLGRAAPVYSLLSIVVVICGVGAVTYASKRVSSRR